MKNFFKKKRRFSENDLNSVIEACLQNSSQAQKLLIKMFFGYAKQLSMRYGATRPEAEEIMNDGFLKVFKHLDKYDHTRPFVTWLRAIFVNVAIDHYRKNYKHSDKFNVDIGEVDIVNTADDVVSKISSEEILSFVHQLTPAYRMVFTLYVVEGYTHREIADMLGIKEGTSKSNLQDARRKLQAIILKAYPHLGLVYELKPGKIHAN